MATKGRAGGGIYYGWVMVAISMFALMLTTGSTMNAFSLYVLPASQDLGLSRAGMNTGLILMNAGSAIASLLLGRLIDRYPARLIMGISACALGGSLVVLGLSHNLWLSAVMLMLPVGLGMTGIGNLTSPALVARWFTVHRGRALAITMMGMSAATIFMAPPIAWLVDTIGWRRSLIATGVIVAGFVMLVLPFVRSEPGPDDRETGSMPGVAQAAAAGSAGGEVVFTQRQLLAQPRFWTIGASTAITQAIFVALMVSLVPIGREIGFSTTRAASLISAIGIAAVSGKFLVAAFADRIDRSLALTALYLLMPLACTVLLFAHTYPLLVFACGLIGLASGATMPLYMALLADRFGARSLGSGNGMIMFGMAVIGAISVRYAGEIYDRTGGYDIMFYSFIALGLVAAGLMSTARNGTARPAPLPAG
ncbi:MAG: MFS transporter [Novosphingobium sp.]|jgi:MFS family permease|nr:MFS transporter [Novosphingobium sp.]